MKFRLPRFSMRSLVVGMLLLGAGLGLVGRELFQIRTKAEEQRAFVEQLKSKGVRLVEEDRKDLTILESLAVWIEDKDALSIVSKVSLWEGGIDEDDLARIAKLEGLREINDNGIHFNDNTLQMLGQNPTLRRVSLEKGWTGTADGAVNLVSGNAPLEEIVLDASMVNDKFVEWASRLSSLSYLHFNAHGVSPNAIKGLRDTPNLKSLYLKNGEGLGDALSSLASHSTLRDLLIHDYTFSGGELEALKAADKIEGLVMTTKQFPPGILRSLSAMKNLKAIGLFGKIDEDEQFYPFQSTRLEMFGIEGLHHRCPGLVDSLSECKSLRQLVLDGVSMTDSDLERLSTIKSLQGIVIGDGPTPEAISRLQHKLPQCAVVLKKADGRRHIYKPGGEFELRQPPPLVDKESSKFDNDASFNN